MQPEHEFHVVGNEITIDFEVPLAASGPDEVLTGLLSHHALEIIRDRTRRGQPLANIPSARISARQSGEFVEIAVLDLQQPDDELQIELPELIPVRLTTNYDPLAKFGGKKENVTLPLAASRSEDLRPIGEEIKLTAGLAAGLRAMGVDPDVMSVSQLGLGLLRLSGYTVTDRSDGTVVAAGRGGTTLVSFVDHQAGEHPELSDRSIAAFLVAFASARTERAMLISDKYAPYGIYAKERANPDALFVARERLQDFVDAIALS